MQAITIDGLSFHVETTGDPGAPAIVFANALGTDLRVWDAVTPLLPAGLHVIRYDKRGHGLSDDAPGRWRIEDFADDLAGILDRLDVSGAAVVGLSVGGLIAQSLAARRPDLVRVLILSGTAAKIGDDALWNERIGVVSGQGVAAVADAILERWFSPDFRERDPSFAVWRNMLLRSPLGGYVATCGAIRDADLTESTRALALPTLAMVGALDGSTPPDLVRGTAALIAGARFEILPGVGHIPGVERPDLVAGVIGDFLKESGHVIDAKVPA
ncbi:3-oxoadipate enol-lactonase [Amaricoccus sp.]|uniref:3-oxoadipate enol-lactonase n=1 Tax=Amaricoccus sp. TaxID=1872485 RepID=UPI001B4492A3|nr:3-oxoadipate enol-lactonase [Amaricoccus sp.]MBP7241862.1 3-oxoadipate enol-lactonase [Amaricoccus sp.]